MQRTFFGFAFACLLAAAAVIPACGGDDDGSAGEGGSGGVTTTTTTTTTDNTGGGGGGCGDTQANPDHCGACGHRCAPGQTCEAGSCVCGQDTASFSADVLPVLTSRCAGSMCHDSSAPLAGLELTAGAAYDSLTTGMSGVCSPAAALVIPGNPADSYLVRKLLGSEMCNPGGRMPPSGSLPEAQIKAISDWICAGAPND